MRATVAIIGAGPLGRWLALAAARAGYRARLEDVLPGNLHHAQEYIREQLNPAALPMVDFAATIEEAVRDADLAIDCVPDELESKLEILWLLDRMAPPRTVLATPTMRLSITDLAACTYRAGQCVAIAAEASALAGLEGGSEILLRTTGTTTPEAVSLVADFWEDLGFVPRCEAEAAS
ncbi:MAG TPA: 3-hydroxyacyl-CoA dehydrogenase NAD-binding domain-containing protein [Terracidiphilus sp.]|nr:3-hydroxyacyl-CoA dehydrogenase NAD-binding domain-containing protein [Terracidiphilus sp.]